MATEQPDRRHKIFVSHISEEAGLGIVVKDGLEDAFSGQVAAFVSSDKRDNPGGDRCLERIERELKDPQTRMLVSLVSPLSLQQPWISIELGAAWILGHAVFPLCHSGQELGSLPRPMQDFGGADLESDQTAERLIRAVEQATSLQVPKRWPIAAFLAEMRRAVHQQIAQPRRVAGTGVVTPAAVEAMLQSHSEISPEQLEILRMLARIENDGIDDIPESEAPRACGLKAAAFKYHVHQLEEAGLALIRYYGEGQHYKITPDGAGWLIKHNQMPD